MNDSNIVHELESRLKKLIGEIMVCEQGNKSHRQSIKDNEERIQVLKIIYTSLLNTALAYKDFDQEEFESGL